MTYKLTYFDLTGMAEPARFLFAYGDIKFDDVRITLDFATWPKLKSNFPYGAVPILEYNGKVINQSIAIARYLGELVGLGGKDAWENLEINASVDNVVDLKIKMIEYQFCRDETKKESLKKTLVEETLPYYMERFEAQVKKNNGYFVGGKLTWADVVITLFLSFFEDFYLKDKFCKKYPSVQKLCDVVTSNEKYKKYLANVDKNKIAYTPK